MGNVRLVVVLLLAGLWILLLTPFQLLGLIGVKPLARWVPVLFHRGLIWMFGIRIRMDGHVAKAKPLMIVSNHVSWLDIVVLSTIGPVSFVAKSEMAVWPLFGQLAKLQRTIFVKRQERRRSGEQANEIADRLSQKDTIVLFPEGTTSDGHILWPFKTALFEAARFAVVASGEESAYIQPIAIEYTRLHGIAMGRQWRQQVAWPGDIGLGENFLPLVKKGALDVVIHCGEPILFTASSNRKVIAAEARASLREKLGRI